MRHKQMSSSADEPPTREPQASDATSPPPAVAGASQKRPFARRCRRTDARRSGSAAERQRPEVSVFFLARLARPELRCRGDAWILTGEARVLDGRTYVCTCRAHRSSSGRVAECLGFETNGMPRAPPPAAIPDEIERRPKLKHGSLATRPRWDWFLSRSRDFPARGEHES